MGNSKGVQFYWSQKNPTVAREVYLKYCKGGDIIFDPFLGAGSSLYGVRDTKFKFVGVELNEMPYQICCFNAKGLNSALIESLKKELYQLKLKYLKFYKYELSSGGDVIVERVLFDNKEDPELKGVSFLDSDKQQHRLENNVELFSLYKQRYLHYKKNNSKLSDTVLEKNSRIAIKDDMYLSSIFSPINFHVLNLISKEISQNMRFVVGSVLHLCKLTDSKSQSQFPYWIPKKDIVDRNIFTSIEKKINQLSKTNYSQIKRVSSFKKLTETDNGCLLFNKAAQKIKNIDVPDNSIDFVLTDPPYFDQVAYSEYLKIWEHFLGYRSYFEDEIIVSQRAKNTKHTHDYLCLMTKAFKVVFNKLKVNGNMVVYFKDSRLDKMAEFLNVLSEVGFEFSKQEYLASRKFTYKQNTSKKSSLHGESIFHFIKKDKKKRPIKNSKPSAATIEKFITEYLSENEKASLGELLNNGLLKYLYENHSLELISNKKNFSKYINKICNYVEEERLYVLKKEENE